VTRRPQPYHLQFLGRPHPEERSGLVSLPAMGSPFHERGARFLVALDRDRRNRLVPPASPTSEPYSRFESVRAFPELPRLGGRCSLDVPPLQSPSHEPRSLRPARPRGPDTVRRRRANPLVRTRGSEDSSPQSQVWFSSSTRGERFDPLGSLRLPSKSGRATPRWRLLLP
jgi:hypothetical protein